MKKNSKFKGKVGFIIVGFAVILIVIGVVMAFLPKEDATSNSKSKSESEPTEEITNDSVELEKVHCLDSLCVENMNVSYALALFQLSSLINVIFGYKFFKETHLIKKLIGTTIMIIGAVVIILERG